MPFKTILAVTGPGLGNGDLNVVERLCDEVNAHMSVLVAAFAPPLPFVSAEAVSEVWLQERARDIEELDARSAAVSKALADSALSVDISSEYDEFVWGDECIGRRSRYADLAVVGPDVLAARTLKDKTVEGVLFYSGTPLLLVPKNADVTLRPRKVLIGWDSGIEASCAVQSSIGLLKGAAEVTIAMVDPIEGRYEQGAEPGADLATYLVRHGIKVRVDRLPSLGRSIAGVLRQHARDTSAELMVMGAYGHSRLRERVFGGVTQAMLEEQAVPLLLSR